MLAYPKIELREEVAEPVIGFERAKEIVRDLEGTLMMAKDFDFNQRLFGQQVSLSVDYIRSGRDLLIEGDYSLGAYGVFEVNRSDPTYVHQEGVSYGVVFYDEKRWLNLTSITKKLGAGAPPCKI